MLDEFYLCWPALENARVHHEKTCGHVSSRDKKKQPFVMRAGLRNNEFCLRGLITGN